MKLTDNLYFYSEKGMLDCNTYVVKDDFSIIIDPGLNRFLPALVKDLRQDGIEPEDIEVITNTHLHIDHYGTNEAFKEFSGAKIVSHPIQKKFYDEVVTRRSESFGLQGGEFKMDSCFDNDRLTIGDIEVELIHSPGHSPDSICFYCQKKKILVCGDIIFYKNTGRVDFTGGNAEELKHSIEELAQLEIEYLLPGHMDIITGAENVKNNFEFIKQNIFQWL